MKNVDYFKFGGIYKQEGIEYVLVDIAELYHFKSFEGYNLFIPASDIEAFLPGVASKEEEIAFVED